MFLCIVGLPERQVQVQFEHEWSGAPGISNRGSGERAGRNPQVEARATAAWEASDVLSLQDLARLPPDKSL